jgi:Cu/Ag efflux pump CusA
VADSIGKIEGVVDVLNGIDNHHPASPAVTFRLIRRRPGAGFLRKRAALDAAAMAIEESLHPHRIVSNDRAYTLRVRFPAEAGPRSTPCGTRFSPAHRAYCHTRRIGGCDFPSRGRPEIRRENLQRQVAITARLEGTDLGTAISEVQNEIAKLHLPTSVRVEYGGTYQEQQKSFRDLVFVMVLAIVFVFCVLLFEFGTFAAPLAILASALLSTSGVFIALLITQTTFNISSFMGMIMVIGIVAKNGILLLD